MRLLNREVSYLDDSFRKKIEPTALGFLRQLTGLTIFDLKGEDTSRTRVVTTLIHGNEPSGFIACHLWMRSVSQPKTNVRIIVCNPEAARSKPIFTNRYIEYSKDLNRFFSKSGLNSEECEIAIRAQQIKQAVTEVAPEAIIDLHNTSGSSPAFGVSVVDNSQSLDLVSLFANRMILTGIKVGAIMEQSFNAPIVTIECGGANDVYSHQVATDGLHEYFTRNHLFENVTERVTTHRHPIRIMLSGDASVGFANHQLPTNDITLRADLEQLNQKITARGEFIGWYDPQQVLPLKAEDEKGLDRIEDLFEFNKGCLYAKVDMQLFMVTTILEIATKDCLFYATVELS